VGIKTGREVNKRGVKVEYRPNEYNGAALARGLTTMVKKGEKVFIARAKDGDDDLTRILADAGIAFDDVPLYEKIKDIPNVNHAIDMVNKNAIDCIALTSSSAVVTFAETAKNIDLNALKAVCIGEKTAAAAKLHGMNVHVAAEAAAQSMVDAIMEII